MLMLMDLEGPSQTAGYDAWNEIWNRLGHDWVRVNTFPSLNCSIT